MQKRKCRIRRTVSSALALGIAAFLVGCSFQGSAGSPRIDGAIEDIDAGSVGEIYCQELDGPPDFFGNHNAQIYLVGTDAFLPMIERVDAVGFNVDSQGVQVGRATFRGLDGVIGLVTAMHPVEFPGNYDAEILDDFLSEQGCGPVPTEGLVAVTLDERPA